MNFTKTTKSNPSFQVLDNYTFFDQGQKQRVFVANILNCFDSTGLAILRAIFEQSGPVHQISLNKEETNQSITAVVHYCSVESAQRAVTELNNFRFNKKPLKVRKDERKYPPKELWIGHSTALANYVFGHNGWSTEIVSLDISPEDGSVSCNISLHIYRTETILVEGSADKSTLTIQSQYTEKPTKDSEKNLNLPKIVLEKSKVLAFEKLRCIRIKYGTTEKIKVVVFATKNEHSNTNDITNEEDGIENMHIENACSTSSSYVEYQ
jgi:RNA recognition motif-containing protein